ncbi:hypothetical protein BDZ45DRAFT_795355 [Acephala macrosclerotiorum]|nr:hypothetical protein BDZ45DRAFT_795355 [Acephala macrosclerotiorum]
MSERDAEFLLEEWSLYGVGVAVILLRFAIRIKTVGFKGFQGDVRNSQYDLWRDKDYMSILTLAMFTRDATTVHIIYFIGTNVEASVLQNTRLLTSHGIGVYTFGSKEQLAEYRFWSLDEQAWYSYTALIWMMKATMLFFNRLTVGLWQHKYIKYVAVFCAASYVVVVLTKNWQVVPDLGLRCTLKMQNFFVTVVLNAITDAAITRDRRPPLLRPVRHHGAIIRVVLTLGSDPLALNINRWGVRETIVGIVTINLPILKPLFNKSFWSSGSFKSSYFSHDTSRNIKGLSEKGRTKRIGVRVRRVWIGWEVWGNDSQEFILQGEALGKGVQVYTTHYVENEEADRGSDG